MSHKLALWVDDVNVNVSALLVSDISMYDSRLSITSPILKVKSPGKSSYVTLTFTANSKDIPFDSVALGLSATTSVIPDGLYIVAYAVSPYDSTKITVQHFRVIILRDSILAKMSAILQCCDIDANAYNDLVYAYMLLQSAIYQAKKDNCILAYEFYQRAAKFVNLTCSVC